MELVQIKTLVNDLLATPGEETGSVDDFSWEDVGTTLENMTADDFKSFNEKFALGVIKTYFDTRRWSKTLDIMTDSQTYEGIKQYVKATLLDADDVSIVSLVNGRDYNDRVYRDLDTKTKIYTKDYGYRFTWSVPQTELHFMFSNAESASGYTSLIESTVANSWDRVKWNTQLSTVVGLIVRCLSNSTAKVVPLVTLYNQATGENLTPGPTAMKDVNFKRWFIEQVANLRSYIMDISTKYNNEGAQSFTPYEDTRVTLLTAIHNSLRNISTFEMIGSDLTLGTYNTVNNWQSTGTALLPSLATVSQIVDRSGDSPVTYSNIVGVIYDTYSCGMTLKCQKVTSDYVAGGDFTNFFSHFIGQSFINEFNNAVVLTLN